MFDETLVVLTTMFEQYERGSDFTKHYNLKTEGESWDLSGRLRELADQIDAQTP